MEIRGRTVVVTGGSSGIGRQVVLGLLDRGARVAAVARRAEALDETSTLAGPGAPLSLHAVDVTDREAVGVLPDAVVAAHGQVDALVNVAGIVHDFTPVADLGVEDMERVMAVNFWGTVYTAKAFLPLLLARPESSLVNVTSMGALLPFPGQSAYSASKAAATLFTEGLISEHRRGPLRVSVVIPGATETEILENCGVERPGDEQAQKRLSGMLRMMSPQEAARRIVDTVVSGRQRVVLGHDARGLDRFGRLLPGRSVRLVAMAVERALGG